MTTEPRAPEDVDFFEDSLSTIFNDIPVSHGTPGDYYHYTCRDGKELRLRLTMTDSWEEQLKFSHFVWEAGLNIARRIESNDIEVRDRRVLELGAGAGLCGFLSVRAGARETILSDYPAESMLTTLKHNLQMNLVAEEQSRTWIVGHLWGDDSSQLLHCGSNGPFDAILLGDCLWMPEQHEALCQTLSRTLKRDASATVHCVAGFHSGRRKLAHFFEVIGDYGLQIRTRIAELCHDGSERVWDSQGPEMDPIERKRWLVVTELCWTSKALGL